MKKSQLNYKLTFVIKRTKKDASLAEITQFYTFVGVAQGQSLAGP